ncbi:DEAD/DEAH box helicase [Pseudomonas kunmingensis]|jgi:ATP-dependent Lhr-like helicase|uniref:Lhr-like helicase n=2 Tax=Gammaproteobacteria TaxID=1236 RepID=L0GHP2_STUST|nr:MULTISPECIES: DEAD/DEAH box helicase [Pseudomonadaceae]WOF80822.1 DEAD/DEAH box helicase [Pseudomonas sp. FeN3W]AGA85496.1 Lhr-like helicase [Stutzerimonas stutzeri RCH2]MBA1241077.1 DEAD/DEAH box helicase [Stutzerimonas kunmingensis]MCQ2031818.1 DEAD/DEAH box helicase [Stutzerimonas zhaodongensis]MCQ2045086.1 DEAD/DEAH box helicase [Stutzerimonas kunmingensis]|tara:strand:- start:237 stop:2456 length:2220 start_codon:yes stop_codon:yes gene_type:complete
MSLPPSSSESVGFELLEPRIQRWIWTEGWTSLRDAQERAIPALLGADQDVIIAAATAAGKTEAAFLPILTNLLQDTEKPGAVLYISPLKALINDQWDRLARLCDELELPVIAWHGDISASRKHRFLKSPEGILLITPESLEALFVNKGTSLAGLFANLRYLVVDELHAFIGSERGKQLQSLMHRVETIIDRPLPRVGLSATLGDMTLAAAFLRPNAPHHVSVIESKGSGQILKAQIRGYVESKKALPVQPEGDDVFSPDHAIAEHLFQVLRGSNNLIFPNSRTQVEWFADNLRRRCEQNGVPNEFWPHHGSLAKDIREETEKALKAGDRPATAVCTTTLELGVDIGSIKTVVQIGAPPSVASLRQRLGRSGRRPGEAAILRSYCKERQLDDGSPLSDRLRQGLLQSIAMIRLLMQGWFEPPRVHGLHLSTLVQQCLSVIAQRGGATAAELWSTLIRSGPFTGVEQGSFLSLLRALGERDLITQETSGLLLPGVVGERLINHYDFYSAFVSNEEFRLVCDGKPLGALPVSRPLTVDQRIIFAGRRWRVTSVDTEAKVVVVRSDPGGAPPSFDGLGARVHDRVRQEMRSVLLEADVYPYLDTTAQELLAQARSAFSDLGLAHSSMTESGGKTYLFSWRGDWTNDALAILLTHTGLASENSGFVIEVEGDRTSLESKLREIAEWDGIDESAVLADVQNMAQEKWDWVLPPALLMQSYATMHLDLGGAKALALALVSQPAETA